ncbi:DUF6470 family protein [Aquibacillus koreensis]|uniref:DUF6470 family protein n=1 Tax=Aquibacillus koreensis TaxID=279446 RepID=A0A9X3WK74_9BACI|nr:DUF6470 family protein [Aquibacillus koreensis]MCT2537254.1 DUF6470 family protein [Aquibacillus koreensis]MDC3421602.1 DUF6470 family protein [Aquibacillus koreensis]
MNFPQIRLQSQMAKIQLNTTDSVQTIEQPKATQSIQQSKANMQIHTSPSRLTIDQTQAWEDMNIKHVSRMIEDAAQAGRQDAAKGTTRRVREGVELMQIENNGNPIARQAKQNSEGEPKQFNIGWIPSHGAVKIDYQPSNVDIDVNVSKPNIQTQINKPKINYQPGSVDVDIAQRNSLDIDFDNLKHVGINFEMTI